MKQLVFLVNITKIEHILNFSNFYYITDKKFTINADNIIKVDVEDKYENLALKTFLGYKEFKRKNIKFDFLCRVDTDTYIDFKNLYNSKFENRKNYGFINYGNSFLHEKNFNKFPFSPGFTEYFLGGGYMINKDSFNNLKIDHFINLIYGNIEKNVDMCFEDVITSLALKEQNQTMVHSGAWIDKKNNCTSSCNNSFFHSLKFYNEKKFKLINKLQNKNLA